MPTLEVKQIVANVKPILVIPIKYAKMYPNKTDFLHPNASAVTTK